MSFKKDGLKYLRMTLSYTNGRNWYLLLVSLIPSVLIAFMITPTGALDFLFRFGDFYDASFGELLLEVSGINRNFYWLGFIGIIVVPFFASVLIGAVERHMRVGEFSLGFSRVRSRLNFNFATSLKFFFSVMTIFFVLKFLQGIMFYMFCRTMGRVWALVMSVSLYVAFFFLGLYISALMVLWVPTMLQTGLGSVKSLGLAVRQGSRYSLMSMGILLVPVLPMMIFMIVNSALELNISIIINAAMLTVCTVYYIVLMYTLFFDINGIEREDLKKINIWRAERSRKRKKKDGT